MPVLIGQRHIPLGTQVPLGGGVKVGVERLLQVLAHPLAGRVVVRQLELGFRNALLCGLRVPHGRHMLLGAFKNAGQLQLRLGVALLGRLEIPVLGIHDILGHALTFLIQGAKAVLSPRVPLFGRLQVPGKCRLEILSDALTQRVFIAKHALGGRIALLGRITVAGQRQPQILCNSLAACIEQAQAVLGLCVTFLCQQSQRLRNGASVLGGHHILPGHGSSQWGKPFPAWQRSPSGAVNAHGHASHPPLMKHAKKGRVAPCNAACDFTTRK